MNNSRLRRDQLLDALFLVAVASCGLVVPIFGQVLLGELILLGLLPLLLAKAPRSARQWVLTGMFLGVVWITGIVIAGAQTGEVASAFGGGARAVFLVSDIVAVSCWLLQHVDLRRALLRVLIAAAIATAAYNLTDLGRFEEYSWKFGVGLGVTFAGLGMATYLETAGRRGAATAVVLLLGAVNLANNFRSLSLILVLGYVLGVVSARAATRTNVVSVLAVVLLGLGFSYAYGYAVQNGALGREAEAKLEEQVSDNATPLRMLLGGRKEVVVSWTLLSESPLLGHGTDYRLTETDSDKVLETFQSLDLPLTYSDELHYVPGAQYPSHSAVLGSWVESGVFSVPFFAAMGLLLSAAVVRSGRYTGPGQLSLVVFSLWNLFFSPIGSIGRLELTIGVAVAVVIIGRWRQHVEPDGVDPPEKTPTRSRVPL